MELLWTIVIGIVAGWLAGLLMKGRGFGLLGDLIVGVIGAFVGGLVFDLLDIAAYGSIGRLVMSVIGALIFLFIIKAIKKRG